MWGAYENGRWLEVTCESDPRGAAETYEAIMLVARDGDRVVWFEGVRRDRSTMCEPYRQLVEDYLHATKEGAK